MKSIVQTVLAATFVFFATAVTGWAQSISLLSVTSTNSFAQTNNMSDTTSNPTTPHIYGTNLIPLIILRDVPITYVLESFAQQGGINYILDQETGYGEPDSLGETKKEPLVTLRLENVTAAYGFMVICTNNNLTVVNDPKTGVVLIRTRDHDINFVKADIYEGATNIIPMVQFNEVPL